MGIDWAFSTRAIHAGVAPAQHQRSTSIPIYSTASYAYESAEELAEVFDGKKFGYIYSRIANPTVTSFEQRMTALENGVGALAVSSGMAAIATVLFALVQQGEEIVSGKSLFGGTFTLFTRIFGRYGVRVRFVDPGDLRDIQDAITEKTKLIFLETIGNPRLDVPDIRAIASLAERRHIPLVVDSTLTTPYLFQAREFGASLVVHSSTKYITGNGSVVGGVIVDLGTFDWGGYPDEALRSAAKRLGGEQAFLAVARRNVMQNTGSCLSPFNAYLHCLGLETLAIRMDKHCSNAAELAGFLKAHKSIRDLNYPGLEEHPCHSTARSQFQGKFGALLTFRMKTREECFRLINHLKLVRNLANLGDAKTLIIHPASTIFHECAADEMAQAGVTENLLRVSVGIEDAKDIIIDFAQALEALA